MNSVYLVFWWDGFCDSSDYLDSIFLDEQEAIVYANNYELNHEESIYVEIKEIGVQRTYKNDKVIYERVLSCDEVIRSAINKCSPMCINIDWDKLYTLYLQYYDPNEE